MTHPSRALLVATSLLFLGLGCSTPPTPPTPPQDQPQAQNNTPPTPPAPSTPSTAGCIHPYLPLKTGYRAVYKSNMPNQNGYTMSVEHALAGQVDLKYAAGSIFVNHTITCQNGELNENSYLDLSRFFVANANRVSLEATHLDGAILPANLGVGSHWTAHFKGGAHEQRSGVSSEVEVTADRTAASTESVTVAAGTFTALKVNTVFTIKTKVLSPIVTELPPIVANGTEWWVEGKGLVKSSATFGSTPVVTEAQSIETP